jgi:hypothetical protein
MLEGMEHVRLASAHAISEVLGWQDGAGLGQKSKEGGLEVVSDFPGGSFVRTL